MTTSKQVGIDRIGMYIPEYSLPMDTLAAARNVDPNKFKIGIGQNQMAVAPLWQDIVSMGANAAYQIVEESDRELIDQVIFATESSFDFSKSAATYIHDLLNIHPGARAIEYKQACYSGTAALQSALDYVRVRPERKVLLVMSDISRYGLSSAAEVTQGAGSIALMITSNPSILSIDTDNVFYTQNEYDFWRPTYSDVALVEGHYSTDLYLQSFSRLANEYKTQFPDKYEQLKRITMHLPYTRIANKALEKYATDYPLEQEKIETWESHLSKATQYGLNVGNIYTGSLYLSLLSLLIEDKDLQAGDRIGLFSYGSGMVAEFFSGVLQKGYRSGLNIGLIKHQFERQQIIDIDEYEKLYSQKLPTTPERYDLDVTLVEPSIYLEYTEGHRRYYNYYEG